MDIINKIDDILNEGVSDVDVKNKISEYKKISEKVSKLQKEIEEKVGDLLTQKEHLEKGAKDSLKQIEKMMIVLSVIEIKNDGLVAKISEELKYKVVRANFQDLWETGLTKVNEATEKILRDLKVTQEELKSKETEKRFSIKEEGIMGGIMLWLKSMINKLKDSMDSFKTASDELENLVKKTTKQK